MHDATGSPRQAGRRFAPGLSRRRFLQYTGLGAAATVTAGCIGGPRAAAAGSSATPKALPEGWSGTIADVKHVVILMQENRSFDHYFGTLRGVRGFGDKQILTFPDGTNIFQQPDQARSDLGYLLPYNLTDHAAPAAAPRRIEPALDRWPAEGTLAGEGQTMVPTAAPAGGDKLTM